MYILLISIHYPPTVGMSSRAMAELSKALVKNGHKIDVLTTEPTSGHPVYKSDVGWMRHVPAQVDVHRVPMGPVNRIAARMLDTTRRRAKRGEPLVPGVSNLTRAAGLSSRLAEGFYAARKIFQPFLIPDANIDWIPAALREARRMVQRCSYDIIASFGYPHTAHLVAYCVRRAKQIPWVMMHAEGWGTSPGMEQLPTWSKTFHRILERKFSQAAARIVICGCAEGLLTRIPQAYGIDPAKLHLAQFAFVDPAAHYADPEAPPTQLRLVFTGAFYGETQQSPTELFHALRIVGSDEITFSSMGPPNEAFETYARTMGLENIQFHGWCAHELALQFQKAARVLVVFGHRGGQQLPTKIYEYFAARRPILCIGADKDDLAARLVLRHRRGIVVPNSQHEIARALLRLLELQRNGTLDSSFDLAELPQYTSEKSGEELMWAVLGERDRNNSQPHLSRVA